MPTAHVLPEADELLQQVAASLFKSRKIVVVTGAGISTNSGIPDFRSENGLYSLIQAQFDAARQPATSQPSLCPADAAASSGPSSSLHEDAPPAKKRKLSSDFGNDGSGSERQGSEIIFQPLPPRQNATKRLPAHCDQHDREEVQLEETDTTAGLSTCRSERTGRLRSHSAGPCTPIHRRPGIASGGATGDGEEPHSMSAARPSARARSLSPVRSKNDYGCGTMGKKPWPCVPGLEIHRAALRSTLRSTLHSSRSSTRRQIVDVPSSPSPLSSTPTGGCTQPALPQHKSQPIHGDFLAPSQPPQSMLSFNSSPLSSPPPVLFDPFQESSSSSSQHTSSVASSTAASETDETTPTSVPSLVSQTSSTSNSSRSSLPTLKGRDLFDVSIWSDPVRTSVFYTFATTLRQKVRQVDPTASHHFIGHLRDRGKLVRCYTQNIDQIEEKVGLSTSLQQGPGNRSRFSRKSLGAGASAASASAQGTPTSSSGPESNPPSRRDTSDGGVECVFLHGSLQSLRCFRCGRIAEWDEDGRSLDTLSGRQPECPHCAGATAARQEKGKRALGVGKLRPDVVLYGEEHPNAHLIDPIVKHDLALYPDFLLILGTSLKVHGLKVLVREFAKTVRSRGGKVVFVNFTKPPESSWGDIIDYWVQWDCDSWVSNLRERIPLLWLPPGTKLPAQPKKKRESSGGTKPARKKAKTIEEGNQASITVKLLSDEAANPESESGLGATTNAVTSAETFAETSHAGLNSDMDQPPDPPSAQPKPPPQRPMSMRDDKINAAYLTWQITRDLRRISGRHSEPIDTFSRPSQTQKPSRVSTGHKAKAPCTPTCPPSRIPLPSSAIRVKAKREDGRPRKPLPSSPVHHDKPNPAEEKKPRQRKPAPGWIYVPVGAAAADEEGPSNSQGAATCTHNPPASSPTATGPSGEQSILAAVKSNPRRRKRKMIGGVEVSLPTATRRATPAKDSAEPPPPGGSLAKPMSRPILPPLIPSPNKEKPRHLRPAHRPPRLLLDESVELAPIRHSLGDRPAPPLKPMPLEPSSPPAGPLATISPNATLRPTMKSTTPFAYFDSLVHQLKQPPVWKLRPAGPFFKSLGLGWTRSQETEGATTSGGI
ncbi:hypothetical protein SODALDRAFT_57957 [Sodiomyces alkalinus F11]|uniref:Deacetylase sirtuin-type domain-containing protein n=1 Tax=Sodiomyces alkalinus (strain CBS 110278 / VKM F-3762 / F11) TaxID=1314773 RepID=A0A3N2PNN1_SODAK|nr:hypothetical protein SODALDRAFT_57957 [Sodiomyces alkalinus F11]ROT36102.1 hypothetical protein SODALDRAFT_57957 [Sodiomyces alkalinus F11]